MGKRHRTLVMAHSGSGVLLSDSPNSCNTLYRLGQPYTGFDLHTDNIGNNGMVIQVFLADKQSIPGKDFHLSSFDVLLHTLIRPLAMSKLS